jgi:ribonuclease HI
MIEAFFDGVCEPRNPGGHGAWGALVRIDGRDVFRKGGYCGHGPKISNNVAEFSGFIEAILQVKKFPGVAIIRGDSKLVIYTLAGKYEVHGGLYVPFFEQARNLYHLERERIGLEWIPRAENGDCDELSKAVLIEKGIRFRIQPLDGKKSSPFPITPAEAIDDGYVLETASAHCSGCQALIDWWITPREKKIPIDAGTFKPHWITCPNAKQFRRRSA